MASPTEDDWFGSSVALDGDTAVVGAIFVDHSGLSEAGAASVFSYDGSTWNRDDELTASDADEWDLFGISAAIEGDTILIGAELHDDNGVSNSGGLFVFEPDAP